MTFKEALEAMKQGVPVKLPSWGGYWWWDGQSLCTQKMATVWI